jgi:ERCC4-type nuclease
MESQNEPVVPAPEVVVDVFERGSGIPAVLHGLGADVTVEPLAAGDYRIRGGILVERKTVADLHGSLGRGRLWAQVGKIRDEAVSPFLLVEGADLDDGPRHPNAIRGALLAIVDMGIASLRSRDPADSALWLHRLATRQARKARPGGRPAGGSRIEAPGVEVLTAVPGISTQTARALIARFGTISGLLAAGPEHWAEVDGIGAIRAHALATALFQGADKHGISPNGRKR